MSQQRSANAVSGKTARACDSCLRRRARWYCAADDAFLCQSCDSSVHSANTLARRHDRVRLKSSSSSSSLLPPPPPSDRNSALPTWHQGFKRKARTPRHAKKPMLLVPDLEALAEAEDNNNVINETGDETEVREEEEEEEEEQLLYRVPIFDPVLAEFYSPPLIQEEAKPAMDKLILPAENQSHGFLAGFNPPDMEFAADVENLLGQGLDDGSFCIDGLGLLEAREDDRSQVKTELMDAIDTSGGNSTNFLEDIEMEFSRESLGFNFDCGSPTAGGDHETEVQKVETVEEVDRSGPMMKVGLRLDYEAVIAAWSCRGCSPWTDGERPQFSPDDCWPDFMGTWGAVGGRVQGSYGEVGIGGRVGNGDGGREARVSRYREKRRSRLFSKKIRYEVRKLNAEKRPRMKGRFVKRASFPVAAVAGFPYEQPIDDFRSQFSTNDRCMG